MTESDINKAVSTVVNMGVKRLKDEELVVLNLALALGDFPNKEHPYYEVVERFNWISNGVVHSDTLKALKKLVPAESSRRMGT